MWSRLVEEDPSPGPQEHGVYRLEAGTAYRFRVRLVLSAGEDGHSASLLVRTQTAAPVAPRDLRATATHDTVSLSWTVPEQPSWMSDYPYAVLSVMRMWGMAVEVGQVTWQDAGTAYRFTDVGDDGHPPYPGQTYEYYIEAYMGGRHYRSETVSVTTAPLLVDPDGSRGGRWCWT